MISRRIFSKTNYLTSLTKTPSRNRFNVNLMGKKTRLLSVTFQDLQ